MNRRIPRFKCPVCGEYIFGGVIDTREHDEGIGRHRECEECGARFMTIERISGLVRRKKVSRR